MLGVGGMSNAPVWALLIDNYTTVYNCQANIAEHARTKHPETAVKQGFDGLPRVVVHECMNKYPNH